MVHTQIIPESNHVYISIVVPDNYVGKKVEIIAFQEEENEEQKANNMPPRGSIAHLRGSLRLSAMQEASLDKHVKDIRKEWDRSF